MGERRTWLILACVVGQMSVLAFMVYGREAVIHSGTRISIATAPIDPRDPFRGDYVRLRYGLNSLDYAPTSWQPTGHVPVKGEKVYAILEPRPGGLHDVSYFTNVLPQQSSGTQQLFLRGRIDSAMRWRTGNRTDARYGIEQLFVQQGTGFDIENQRGIRGGMQNAMQAQIAVGDDGTAVLTGYTWSALAVGLELTELFPLEQPQTVGETSAEPIDQNAGDANTPTDEIDVERESASIALTVSNVSEHDITLNNPGDNCGFNLEPAARGNSKYHVPEGVCADLPPNPVTLVAGESMVLNIDLSAPRWHMSLSSEDTITTNDVRRFTDSGEWFRLVYRSDDFSDTTFWQGDLISQAFNAIGRID